MFYLPNAHRYYMGKRRNTNKKSKIKQENKNWKAISVSLDNNCQSRGKKKSFAKEIVPIAGDANMFVFWYFICCLQNKKKRKERKNSSK